MNPEDSDPVWHVLGRGRRVDVRPDFARTVISAARSVAQDPCLSEQHGTAAPSGSPAPRKLEANRPYGSRIVRHFAFHPWSSGLAAAAAIVVLAVVGRSVLNPDRAEHHGAPIVADAPDAGTPAFDQEGEAPAPAETTGVPPDTSASTDAVAVAVADAGQDQDQGQDPRNAPGFSAGAELLALMFDPRTAAGVSTDADSSAAPTLGAESDPAMAAVVTPALPELESALTELEDADSLLAVEDAEMLEDLDDGALAALLF